jgi:CRP-like cAMP-binding protein
MLVAKDGPLSEPAAALAQSPLFGQLTDSERDKILSRAEPVSFAQGTTIFDRGDETDALYVLLHGTVCLAYGTRDGRRFAFPIEKPGEIFGEIGTLDGSVRSGAAIATTEVVALRLAKEAVVEAMAECAALTKAIILFLCARLRGMNDWLETIALRTVEAKIARFLLSSGRARGRHAAAGKVAITLNLSASELSLLIGEPRQQTEAALALMRASGAVRREGDTILCDIAVLLQIADEG